MKIFNKTMDLLKKNFQSKMGIIDFNESEKLELDFKRSELRELEIELNTKGREIQLKDIRPAEDGTMEYMGKKVILYMRDQYIYANYKYKFHISWCEALEKMKREGRIHRYVVSNRRDGIFIVNEFDEDRKLVNENVEKSLEVCVWCLGKLKYDGFVYGETSSRRAVSDFKLKEFFQKYDTSFKGEEESLQGAGVVPLNEYGANWRNISRVYREKQGWYCEKCGKNLNKNKGELETHHINRNKFDVNESNLMALCHRCHEKEHENDC